MDCSTPGPQRLLLNFLRLSSGQRNKNCMEYFMRDFSGPDLEVAYIF